MKIESDNILDFVVDFTYADQAQKVLNSVRGQVKKGQCIVLCGASGCGKSTLLRCLNNLIPEFYAGELKGYIYLHGEEIANKSIGEVGQSVYSVFQDPRSQFFTLESDSEIAFALENKGVAPKIIRQKVQEAFHIFKLDYLANKEVYRLSSGERQLVMLMAAWAANTEVILLDEPTANLDYLAIEKLAELLLSLKKAGKTIIISEHRLYYLQDIADEYWQLENGSIKNKIKAKEFRDFSLEKLHGLGLRLSNLSQLQHRKPVLNQASLPKLPIQQGEQAKLTLEAENLSFAYKQKNVLNNLTLTVKQGEVTFLLGHNGAGKTTLGRCLCGLLKLKSGVIRLNGASMTSKTMAKNSLFIRQEAEFQFFTNSVWQELTYGVEKSQFAKVKTLLKRLDMWQFRDCHPCTLSGGQMQKLTLMLAYLSNKKLLVLDEPTSGLDQKSMQTVVELIHEMKDDKLVIVISHDLELLSYLENNCLELVDGTIVAACPFRNFNSQANEAASQPSKTKQISQTTCSKLKNSAAQLVDPRTNIVFLLLAMLAVGLDLSELILACNLLALCIALINRHYKAFFITASILLVLYAAPFVYPNSLTLLMTNLLPRFALIFLLFPILLGGRGATNMLAALRKLAVSEKVILVLAVIFRFFPVLKNDFIILQEVLQNRANCLEKSLVRRSLAYCEALIISLVFRVLRIAETLSASAETRGLALQNKKTTYIDLHFQPVDYGLLFVMLMLLIKCR